MEFKTTFGTKNYGNPIRLVSKELLLRHVKNLEFVVKKKTENTSNNCFEKVFVL